MLYSCGHNKDVKFTQDYQQSPSSALVLSRGHLILLLYLISNKCAEPDRLCLEECCTPAPLLSKCSSCLQNLLQFRSPLACCPSAAQWKRCTFPSLPAPKHLLALLLLQTSLLSPCMGGPGGAAAAHFMVLRPPKYGLHVPRIEHHPPPIDPPRP